MTGDRIHEILSAIKGTRMAVYGDFCLDAYWMLDPRGSEASVETGLQANAVARHYYSLGGAANIVANLAALEPVAIRAVGVVGADLFGRELLRQLHARGVNTDGIVIQEEGFSTPAYCKQYLEGKEQPRYDFGCFNRRTAATDAAILASLESTLRTSDALICNQQWPDSLANNTLIDDMNALFARYPDKVVLLDSRHCADRFTGVSYKANEVEAARLCGVRPDPADTMSAADVRTFAETLHERSGKPVFITRGPRGIVSCDRHGVYEMPGIQLLKKLDTVGAGDTVVSALGCCLAAAVPPAEAAEFANVAAAVTVQKLLQTGTAAPPEILDVADDPDYIYQPELAEDIRQARYFADTEVELCCAPERIEPGRIAHVVFDHDGTISSLRQGWEAVMEPVMMHAILGETYGTADETIYQRVQDRVLETIDKTTGIQTILQMEALVELVDEFGLVPPEDRLDKFGYKERYNQALMDMVNGRIEKLRRGELDVADCTIKGAVAFLQWLYEQGVTLYLASGTDREDVIREAEALGYAHLFTGGIYGAVGDISKYSKKMVIKDILSEHKLKGPELACFGDGPVEIRECRRHGGIAVGLATDEMRRFGLNPDKRPRLIKAGASLIAPDFSQADVLKKLLFGISVPDTDPFSARSTISRGRDGCGAEHKMVVKRA